MEKRKLNIFLLFFLLQILLSVTFIIFNAHLVKCNSRTYQEQQVYAPMNKKKKIFQKKLVSEKSCSVLGRIRYVRKLYIIFFQENPQIIKRCSFIMFSTEAQNSPSLGTLLRIFNSPYILYQLLLFLRLNLKVPLKIIRYWNS